MKKLYKKTSIYIEPELDRLLARTASDVGITKAQFIRDVLAKEVSKTNKVVRPSVGIWEGPTDLAANTDHYLEGFGRSDSR